MIRPRTGSKTGLHHHNICHLNKAVFALHCQPPRPHHNSQQAMQQITEADTRTMNSAADERG